MIDEGNHTISVTVPYGTDVRALVPTVAFTGDSVAPASGVSQDFTDPVKYTVTSGASTMDYTVTVTVSDSLSVGDFGFGGTVAYILGPNDPGYEATVQHGLVMADTSQGDFVVWSTVTSVLVGTTSSALGTGAANTAAIVAQPGCTGGAAYLCDQLLENGYSDWFLPSSAELGTLIANQSTIGLPTGNYWSSTEVDKDWAMLQYTIFGSAYQGSKSATYNVRAVRAF
jgi:hypothetical protein